LHGGYSFMNDLNWELVRVFLAVARSGSLSRAAEALASSQPTVGRQVATLEFQLGTPLVIRSPRGVALTDAGRTLYEASGPLVDGMTHLQRAVRGETDTVGGTVRITAPEPLAVYVLPGVLAPLSRALPSLHFEVVSDNRVIDLLAGEADIAVRLLPPDQQDLVRSHVGASPGGLFASQAYITRRGHPDSFEALVDDHDIIGFDRNAWAASTYKAVDSRLVRQRFAFRSDSICAQLEAARAGHGVVAIQLGIARLLSGLVRVLPEVSLPPSDIWLTMHQDVRQATAVRRTFTTLKQGLADYLATAETPEA
jgi:DNA-binding transcriptional LysR family regulator